jgi:hypothetical protein
MNNLKINEWNDRLTTLKNTIIDNIKNSEFNNNVVKIVNLFYDQ